MNTAGDWHSFKHPVPARARDQSGCFQYKESHDEMYRRAKDVVNGLNKRFETHRLMLLFTNNEFYVQLKADGNTRTHRADLGIDKLTDLFS